MNACSSQSETSLSTGTMSSAASVDLAIHSRPRATGLAYDPLETENGSLRLLKYTKQVQDGVFDWSLHTTSLAHAPPFAALSYVWGKPDPVVHFRLSDRVVRIRENLADALKHLEIILGSPTDSDLGGLEFLWVDALCINQEDDDEKSHQVQMMPQIYSTAKITIGWLGKGTSKSAEELRAVVVAVKSLDLSNLSTTKPFHRSPKVRREVFDQIKELALSGTITTSSLKPIFRNSFWRRVWILQETTNPKSLVYAYGYATIDWTILFAMVYLLDEFKLTVDPISNPDFGDLVRSARSPLHMLWRREKALGRLELDDLEQLLPRVRADYLASDPRDLIYALLGLPRKDHGRLPIEANYSISVGSLYTKMATAMLKSNSHGVLNRVLFWAQRLRESENDLPSWVPDWRDPGQSQLSKLFDIRRRLPSGARFPPRVKHIEQVLDLSCQLDGEVLCLEGYQIDTVKLVSVDCLAEMDGPTAWETWCENLESTLISSHERYLNSVVRRETTHMIAGAGGEEFKSTGTGWDELRDETLSKMKTIAAGRKAFTTETGQAGLGPKSMKPGDLICVVEAKLPIILTKTTKEHYRYLGLAYLHGVMYGTRGMCIVENLEKQTFKIE
jgi:hypothetical protein